MVEKTASRCCFFELNYLLFFAVLIEEISIRLSSRQSFSMEEAVLSSIIPDFFNTRSQYSVSAASFKDIWSLAIKSALLLPYCASLTLAPMEVPLRSICLDITDSCFDLRRYWWSLTIRAPKSIDFSISNILFHKITSEHYIKSI